MEIKFIGTGSGSVSLDRYHSSFLIQVPGQNLLMDAGDSISRALRQSSVDINSINSILISHFHPDHLNGLSSLIIQMKMNKRKEKLQILVHENLLERLRRFLEYNYIFNERTGFELQLLPFRSGKKHIVSSRLSFLARENTHLEKYMENIGKEDISTLVSCSFLFDIGERKVFYTADVGGSEDLYLFSDMRPNVIITEATHIEPEEIGNAFRKLQPERVILTHINSHESQIPTWMETMDEETRSRFIIACDGMTYKLV